MSIPTEVVASLQAILAYLGDERADYDRMVAAGDIEPGSDAHVWTHVTRVESWMQTRDAAADVKIIGPFTFTFTQLSADAQVTAVEQVREKLAGQWWDTNDTEQVGETILYVLGEKIKTPGWDTYGEADFPGIKGIKVDGWDVERAASLDVSGYLTPDAAPGLPWPADCDRFRIGRDESRWTGGLRGLWIADSEPEWPADLDRPDVAAFLAAWDDAVAAAVKAGRDQMEYMTSAEYAAEWLDGNEAVTFTVDGEIEP